MDLQIRTRNFELTDELQEHLERRLAFALRRFLGRIDRVAVRITDENGPRGGIDKSCQVAVALVPRGMVRIDSRGDEPFALIATAAKRAGQAVGRALERRRARLSA